MNDTKEMTTGPEISSKAAEAEAFEEPTKEQTAAAPGLPDSGKVEPSSGERLSMKLPGPPAQESTEQTIVSVHHLGFSTPYVSRLRRGFEMGREADAFGSHSNLIISDPTTNFPKSLILINQTMCPHQK